MATATSRWPALICPSRVKKKESKDEEEEAESRVNKKESKDQGEEAESKDEESRNPSHIRA